ncbi:MAG: hypothetical protein L3K23_02380 [Thermoplasmata archaeon]|nr:hypothetical protein [Thermoplasmata archaeon]
MVTVVSLVSRRARNDGGESGLFVPFYGAYLGSALAAREARTLTGGA